MTPQIQTMAFHGHLTQRGFWLYVWEIQHPKGVFLYVGRNGDSSSLNASSPFARIGQHLHPTNKGNTIRRHLNCHGIAPETCDEFKMVAYGPFFPEAKEKQVHYERRDKAAALEKALADALRCGKYKVLNKVDSKKHLDPDLWKQVREAFAEHFDRICQSDAPQHH